MGKACFSQKFLKLVEETKRRYDLIYEKDRP